MASTIRRARQPRVRHSRIAALIAALGAVLLLPLLSAGPAQSAPTAALASDAGMGRSPYGHHRLAWSERPTGSTAQFRGLDVVSRRVVWVAGSLGTVLRTLDGGRTWQDVSPPVAGPTDAPLLFRDVEAFSARVAQVLAIGTGQESQIWRTTDGGATWTQTFVNEDPAGFYDCMAFWDRRNGIVLGDPVDGRWQLLRTRDGGRTWRLLPRRSSPAALEGEFAFAASGTCITTAGRSHVWFAGGGPAARVYRSSDRGRTWRVTRTPVAASPEGAGIFSLAFRGTRTGIAVGGDFTVPDRARKAAAYTRDGGRTWTLAERPLSGYRSGSAWLPRKLAPWRWAAVAVGPTGSDVTWDGGKRWYRFDTAPAEGPLAGGLDSVECSRDGACFGSGRNGRVARLVLRW